MARSIKQGQHIFIAFQDKEAVLDSQLRPRMYKSREQFEKSFPRWGQVASEQGKQLDKLRAALDELEQVKHQLDSYRAYYDDMASKPNCNTCADKDCKYRPIQGDTVRANCPLWRDPQKED